MIIIIVTNIHFISYIFFYYRRRVYGQGWGRLTNKIQSCGFPFMLILTIIYTFF